jgi:dTDP-4-amino-4,6-dideoxygalactose transaminase
LPQQSDFAYSAYHLYVIRLDLEAIAPLSHVKVFQDMRDLGILVNIHYIPVHTQPYYQAMGFNWGDFPNAESYYRNSLSIPIFPKMNDLEQTQVIEALHQVLG